MSCIVVGLDNISKVRYRCGTLIRHVEMNNWLTNNGEKDIIYEIWKGASIHSRWCWKPKKNSWGKMATPSDNDEYAVFL